MSTNDVRNVNLTHFRNYYVSYYIHTYVDILIYNSPCQNLQINTKT